MIIVIEGIDGSGKTTVAKALTQKFRAEGYTVKYARDPGDTLLSERIRAMVKDKELPMCQDAQMLMFAASRAELYQSTLKPLIETGVHIILDRWWFSTFAYQGVLGVDQKLIIDVAMGTSPLLRPTPIAVELLDSEGGPPKVVYDYDEFAFYLDVALDVAKARRAAAGNTPGDPAMDRFDGRDVTFHLRLRDEYQRLAKHGLLTPVNAGQPPEGVVHDIWEQVSPKLGGKIVDGIWEPTTDSPPDAEEKSEEG